MAHAPTSLFEPPSKPASATPLSDLEDGRYSLGGEQESPGPSIIQKVVAELIGTYILIFIGCGSLFVDNLTLEGVALAWSAVVVALIYSIGHISGAHLNPAVTIALAAIGRFPWKQVPLYVAVQVVGSTAASATLCRGLHGERAGVMLTLPGGSTTNLNAIVLEIIISFILMFVICAAGDNRAINELFGVAIGATIFFNVIVAGKISGCSMNPARSLGPAIATKNFHKVWIYIISPVIGTITASVFYQLFRLSKKKINVIPTTEASNMIGPS